MKTLKFDTREDWLAARVGRITGSRLKDIIVKRGTGKKIGFYQLVAERLGIPADDESPMDRGVRLESEAITEFTKATGKDVDTSLVMWEREDNPNIAVSPDGFIGDEECVEAKCLASARHIEALLTQEVPSEHKEQVIQYFVCNDQLTTLYMVFYDPRLTVKPFFYLTIKRSDVAEEVAECLEYERKTLAEVDEIVERLTSTIF
jgi:predicted phage-related endonuclease